MTRHFLRPARRRLVIAVLAVMALATACSGGDSDGGGAGGDDASTTSRSGATTTSEATTTTADAALGQSCTNDEEGYTVSYPADWHTNDGSVVTTCRLFDAEPVEVEPATEADEPVLLDVEPVEFDQAAQGGQGEEVLSRRATTVAGREAVRLETEAGQDAPLRDPGDRDVRWVVRLAPRRTFIATARAANTVAYDEAVEVVDAMMQSVSFTPAS